MAVSVLAPAVVLSVQLPTVAMPEESVVAEAPVMLPLPEATAKVTATPATGLLLASVTRTLGGMVTAVPTWTVWPLPAFEVILLAAPATPVAVKVSGEPESPAQVAVSVLAPAVGPSFQLLTSAMPEDLVVTVNGPVIEPPPEATANVTSMPETGLPPASITFTLGAVATARPAIAVWSLPALMTIVVAGPEVPVAVNVTGEPETPAQLATGCSCREWSRASSSPRSRCRRRR